MTNELKKCPFCEETLLEFGEDVRNGEVVTLYIHPIPDKDFPRWDRCPLSGLTVDAKRWEFRPIEDGLNKHIAELTTQLHEQNDEEVSSQAEAIAELCEHISELDGQVKENHNAWLDATKELANAYNHIAKLEDQLRFRPVSEKPTEDGKYEVKFVYRIGNGKICYDILRFSGAAWLYRAFDDEKDIIEWRPIPELEIKNE